MLGRRFWPLCLFLCTQYCIYIISNLRSFNSKVADCLPVPLFAGSLVYISISFNLPFVLRLSNKIIICASFHSSLRGYSTTKNLVSAQLRKPSHFFSVHSLSTLSHIFIEGSYSHIKTVQFSTTPKIRIYTTREPMHSRPSWDPVHEQASLL